MPKLSEFRDLQNEEIDSKLLKEAIEKSKRTCKNCAYCISRIKNLGSGGYRTTWDDFCTNTKLILACNQLLLQAKSQFPNVVAVYADEKRIVDSKICGYFE